MTVLGRPFPVIVRDDGCWWTRATIVRLVRTPGQEPPDELVEDVNGDHEVVACRTTALTRVAYLTVEIRKIR